jgi:hypothetical protein
MRGGRPVTPRSLVFSKRRSHPYDEQPPDQRRTPPAAAALKLCAWTRSKVQRCSGIGSAPQMKTSARQPRPFRYQNRHPRSFTGSAWSLPSSLLSAPAGVETALGRGGGSSSAAANYIAGVYRELTRRLRIVHHRPPRITRSTMMRIAPATTTPFSRIVIRAYGVSPLSNRFATGRMWGPITT